MNWAIVIVVEIWWEDRNSIRNRFLGWGASEGYVIVTSHSTASLLTATT